MEQDRVALFVRLPREQALALDRLADSTGQRKQQLVSELLGGGLSVGHVELRESSDLEDVLTLEEAAAMLRLPVQAVLARARAGELPGRRFGEDWRFAREALLSWLAEGETAPQRAKPAEKDER